MTKRIVLQGLELWGDVHYTVRQTLAQSHPQQPWSRSPAQPIALEMDGAGGVQEDEHSCLSHQAEPTVHHFIVL